MSYVETEDCRRKLSDDDVRELRRLRQSGMSQTELAARYDCTAQNINATWTKSGHLKGRVKKTRSQPKATCGSMSYALLLGYLQGARGESLLNTEFTGLLDCSFERLSEFATEASRKGWIVFKRLGNVIEVRFPNLLTDQEMEWLREQN